MLETKLLATERLRNERRWDKFQTHRLKCVAKLRKERGGSKGDVNDDAWALALAEFPPLKVGDGCIKGVESAPQENQVSSSDGTILEEIPENPAGGESGSESGGLAAKVRRPAKAPEESYNGPALPASGTAEDISRDVMWVYQHLQVTSINRLPTPPSGGALSMWKFARDNRKGFFEQLLPKAARATEKSDTEKAAFKGDVRQVEVIQKMLAGVVETVKDRGVLYCVNCGHRLAADLTKVELNG